MWGDGASPWSESLPQTLVRWRAKNVMTKSYWYSPFHNLPLFTVSRVWWHNLTLKLHGHKPPLCWKMHHPHSQVHRHVPSTAARNDQHCLPPSKMSNEFLLKPVTPATTEVLSSLTPRLLLPFLCCAPTWHYTRGPVESVAPSPHPGTRSPCTSCRATESSALQHPHNVTSAALCSSAL